MSLLNTDEYKSNKTDDGFIFTNEENIVFIDTETDEENVKGVFEDEINIDEI